MSKKIFFIIILVVVGLYWWFVQQSFQQSYQQKESLVGKLAPGFTVGNEEGEEVSLSDHKGKVVLVHFWATWCPPCLHEFPFLNRFQKKFSPDKFIFLAISEDEKGSPDLDLFKEKVSFDFPIFFDHHGHISDAYGTYKLPETYLVDQQGRIVRKYIGPQNWDDSKWEEEIRELLMTNVNRSH